MLNSTFKIVYLVGLIIASVIRGRFTFRYRSKKYRINRDTFVDYLFLRLTGVAMIVPFVYIFSGWLDFADYFLPYWTGWVGCVIFIAFCWLLWRSHMDLGENWTPTLAIRTGHTLQTGGVFAYIRHPMYAAHILWAIAQPLILHNWIAGFSLLLFVVPQYIIRVGKEERMMLDEFGDQYRRYMQTTGRIIPKIKWTNKANQQIF
jgi:protein-S-isoprenylcysteine O-methyltransferase Ste14